MGEVKAFGIFAGMSFLPLIVPGSRAWSRYATPHSSTQGVHPVLAFCVSAIVLVIVGYIAIRVWRSLQQDKRVAAERKARVEQLLKNRLRKRRK